MTEDAPTSPHREESSPPATGEPAVNEALGRLSELVDLPVVEHHDRFAQAHAVLDGVLHRDEAHGA